MPKVYVPTTGSNDWRRLLADPAKQWRTGFSAKTLALSLAKMLSTSKMARFAFSLRLKTKPVIDQDLLLGAPRIS